MEIDFETFCLIIGEDFKPATGVNGAKLLEQSLKPLCKLESWSAVWVFFLFVSFLISTHDCSSGRALIKGVEPRKTLPLMYLLRNYSWPFS